MRRLLALALVVACEQAPPTEPTPPAPVPVPVPVPVPPITPSPVFPIDHGDKLYDVITFRLSTTELSANGIRLLVLTPSTTRDEIEQAAFAALSPPQIARDVHISVNVDKSIEYGRVVAILEAAKRAGYTKLAVGTLASP